MAAQTPKAEETRRHILKTALGLFRKKGFDSTTMRDVAQAAGMATGAAYYHFESKEALVLAFYQEAQSEMDGLTAEAKPRAKKLQERIGSILSLKFEQFGPERQLLGALFRHAADPHHPLSPFSDETRGVRNQAIRLFAEAIEGSDVKVPEDLKEALPRLFWLYQLGLILFWIYDTSPHQRRTQKLMDQSLGLLISLLKISTLPLMKPLRRGLLDLLSTVEGMETAKA